MSEERELWRTKIGAIFAFMAATVGLGSLWRFPFKLGVYGGATFLLIYGVFYILVGIPAYIAETILGKNTKKNPAGAFEEIAIKIGRSRNWKRVGDLIVIFGTILNSQYLVVVGWTVIYFCLSLSGIIYSTNSDFLYSIWNSVFPGWLSVVGLAIATAYCTFFIIRGVSKGIERVNSILMPALFLILIAGVVRALTLPNSYEGVIFLFYPRLEPLYDWVTWLQALGQVYFTTALGIGFIITYGSYMKKDQNVEWNTYAVSIGDNLASILAGLAIFPAVFAFGLNPDSGPNLAFIILPQIFAKMPYGYFLGVIFFLGFAIAALECTKAAFEVATAYLVDEFKFNRKKAALIVGVFEFLVGVPSALSFVIWDLFDWLWTIIPPLMGLITTIFIGWIWKVETLEEEKIHKIWIYLLKYFTPFGILTVFAGYAYFFAMQFL